MAKQKLDQETQVGKSDVYDDTFPPGPTLESNAQNARDDLNALRSQLRRHMYGADPGDWKDDPATAFGSDASLKALHASLGFDEDKILVMSDGSLAIDSDGNIMRRR